MDVGCRGREGSVKGTAGGDLFVCFLRDTLKHNDNNNNNK